MRSPKRSPSLGEELKLTKDELDSSTELRLLDQRQDAFLNSQGSDRPRLFKDFCDGYLIVVHAAECRNVLPSLTPQITCKVLKFIPEFAQNRDVMFSALGALSCANAVVPIVGCKVGVSVLLRTVCVSALAFDGIWEAASPLLVACFGRSNCAAELATSSVLVDVLGMGYMRKDGVQLGEHLSEFFFGEMHKQFFADLDYKKILNWMFREMRVDEFDEEMSHNCAQFLTMLFVEMTKVVQRYATRAFKELDFFNVLKKLTGKIDGKEAVDLYFRMLDTNNDDKTPAPNISIYNHVFQLFQQRKNWQNAVFEKLSDILLESNHEIVFKLNGILPFSQWFQLASDVAADVAMRLLAKVFLLIPEEAPKCIHGVFIALKKEGTASVHYAGCLAIIEMLFTKRLISLSTLLAYGFIDVFVTNVTSEYLVGFFTEVPTFSQLLLDILTHEKDVTKRESAFIAVVHTSSLFEDRARFVSLCSALLAVCPSTTCVSEIIRVIEEHKAYDFLDVFVHSFPKSTTIVTNFVDINGLEWIFDLCKNGVISNEKLAIFLMSLVSQKPCKTLTRMIKSLEYDHPVFSLTQEQLKMVVFGSKDKGWSRPIRVPTLFYKLEFTEEKVDPFNAYMIGKYALPRYSDLSKVNVLSCVANRFMLPADVERVFDLPLQMESFCDLSYDHFPLFQFYAGQGVMRITHKFQSLSFWFKFDQDLGEDEVQLLHCDSLLFTLNGTSLTATCDMKTFVVDATPDKWTHVYIRIKKSTSPFGGPNHFRISLNNDFTFVMTPKSKITEFTFASIGSGHNVPLLFLGSAIRLSDLAPDDISILHGKGPGYIEPSKDLHETLLVTPFSLQDVEIPLTCFTVPYMGFCLNNLSNRSFKRMLHCMCETEDRNTYDSVFNAACNINRITSNNNARFWKQLLHNIKHAKLHPTVDMFKEALNTVLCGRHCDTHGVFSSMIYAGVLWEILDPNILATALLECFPAVNWKDYPDSDIFLATVVRKNPNNRALIMTILRNFRKVPRTVRILAAMLKCDPVKDWQTSAQRSEPTELQLTLVESFSNFVGQNSIDVLKTLFTFEELRYLIIISPDSLAVKVFHLAASMAAMIPDFIRLDPAVEMRVAALSRHESIWKDVQFLMSGDPDCQSTSMRRPYLINLLMVLIWALGIQIIHVESTGKALDFHMKSLETRLNKSCKFLKSFTASIAGTPGCVNYITTFYPLILNYPVLFDDQFECPDSITFPAIPLLTPANMGDMEDSVWSGYEHVAHKVEFVSCGAPQSGKDFLKSMISKLLGNPVFDFEVDWERIASYVKRSHLFRFIADVLLNLPLAAFPSAVYNFVFLRPFESPERSQHLTSRLVFLLLKRVSTPLPPQLSFTQLLSLVAATAVSKHLANEAVAICVEIFTLCETIVNTIGLDGMKKLSPLVMSILITVLESAPDESCIGLQQVFCHFSELFSSIVDVYSLAGWCWIFRDKFKKLDENQLCEVIRQQGGIDYVNLCNEEVQVDDDFKERARQNWALQVTNAQMTCEESSLQYKEVQCRIDPVSEASFSFTRREYIATCKHFLISQVMNHMFLLCDSVFPLNVEKGKWINFLIRQQEIRSEISLFNPVTYHLSARCVPFCPPMVLTPSFSPFLDHNYETSPAVKLFQGIASFVQKPPLTAKETLLNLFYKSMPEMGTPLAVLDCCLFRYANQIPSVSFWFPDNIVVLTFAQLTDTGKELIFVECMDSKMYHIFIEAVLLGDYGLTTLFASHIAIVIPLSSILYIHRHSSSSLALWTFNSGHFLLNFTPQALRQISPFFDKINKVAMDSFPIFNYLTTCSSNYNAYQKWIQRKLTTQQFLYTLNCLSGRSYADLSKYPYLPKSMDSEFQPGERTTKLPGAAQTAGLLYRILPFRYYAHEDRISELATVSEVPATILVVPEILMDMNSTGTDDLENQKLAVSLRRRSRKIRESLESAENNENVKAWVHSKFTINPPRSISVDSLKWEKHLTGQVRKAPTGHSQPSDALSEQLSQLIRIQSTVINISRRKSKLSIVNNVTDNEYYTEYNFIYGHAISISVSSDSVFFAIDFAFGLTRVYKVIFSKGIPVTANCLSEFSAGSSPKSSVSSHEWVCATASGTILVLWEIVSGTVHRVIHFEDTVSAVSFDESSSSVWAAIGSRIVLIALNGAILAETQISERVSALTRVDGETSAICGTDKGRLFVLRYDLEQEKISQTEMQSQHECYITKIVWQREVRRYLSVDVLGRVFQWNTEGTPETEVETSVFTSCAVCTNPTHTICQFCNKPICAQCRPGHLRGPNCRHCIAFM